MLTLIFVLTGLAAGVLSVLLGVGGGMIIVPALVYFATMDMKIATGTSLAVIIPTAIMGTIKRAQAHQVDWHVFVLVAAGAIVGALVGARLVHMVSGDVLKRLFALVLLFTAVRMLMPSR